ncbi:MAG: hypothetical protein JNN16_09385 [Nitrospira sp.]|nr:hypothetical protein [Nitrospira sp.]
MQMMKRWLKSGPIVTAAAICVLSAQFSVAQAALVNYSFTGTVSNISGALLSPTMNLTSSVSGAFQFDNSTTGTSGPHVGNFPGAVTGMIVHVGGYTASYTAGANAITLFDNVGFGDRWRLATDTTGGVLPDGYSAVRFDLQLDHDTGGAFSGTNLQNPPSLASLTGTRWRLLFEDATGNTVNVRGAISQLTAVPLPTAVLLFGAGLISLVGLGAGGLRNLRASKV